MSKLATKHRPQATRTGQNGFVTVVDTNGNLVQVPTGNGSPGSCGPMPATQTQSWGAACPPGQCTSESLAAALNRAFAGERYPCRELTYWIPVDPGGATTASFDGNALVTICPTRVIAMVTDSTGTPVIQGFLSRFTVGNQNQIVGDPLPLEAIDTTSYSIIPFVTDCIKAGMPWGFTMTGLPADGSAYFGIIGPAIG